MSSNKSLSSRIVNNTFALFIRTLVTMLIALYTSRVVLGTLGVDDYGLYGVVGGVVSLFTLIIAGLTTATQRFLSYEIGRGCEGNLNKVFSTCFYTHVIYAIFFLLLCETLGVLFVNNYLQIPDGRTVAANWIFQFSIISFCISLLTIPYSACLISRERMKIYAYIGILDAVLKLVIALLIPFSDSDKLIFYGACIMLISIVNFLIYKIICNRLYDETSLTFQWDNKLFKKIFSFTSWAMLGEGSMVCANQGNTILINMFFTVVANAANSIASQVNTALKSLSSNFFAAVQPQITKSFASKDYAYTLRLVHSTSKLSFFLTFLIAFPLVLNIDLVLQIWLRTVPENTSIFCILLIISSLVSTMGNPSWTVIYATGNIRRFQIISSFIYLSDLLIVYVFFNYGYPVYMAFVTKLGIDLELLAIRIIYTKKGIPTFSYRKYCLNVILPIVITVILSVVVGYLVIALSDRGALKLILTVPASIFTVISAFYLGLSKDERTFALSMIRRKL